MRILAASDYGIDGIEIVVWLDESKTIIGPDAVDDVRPDPAWVWRTTVSRAAWDADNARALMGVYQAAELELRRRNPVRLEALIGADLEALVANVEPAVEPTPTPEEPA